MSENTRGGFVAETLARYFRGQISRREALRLLGVLGLTAAGGVAIGARDTGAKPAAGPVGKHAGHGSLHAALLRQDDGAAAATPQLGEQSDGSRIWRVHVGGMDMENLIDLQGFFPKEITINAGDSVFFELPTPPGFHTITFLSGQDVPPLFIPDPDMGTPAATPAAGPPKLIVNPAVAFPEGGATYDGTGFLNSGLDVLRQPSDPPLMVTFTTAGTYEYECIPHGVVMKGTVVVQEAGAAVADDQTAVDARAEQERAALIEEGKTAIAQYAQATSTARDDGTTLWEIAAGAGEGQARVMQFLPNALEIKVGDTVRWINYSKTEPHTVTFIGTGAEQPVDILIEPQPAGPPKLVLNPLTLFPQGGQVYNGQGYVNSGLVGEINGEPLPGIHPYEITFDTAGEYPYYCILHASGPEGPGMAGTITVS